MRYRTEIIENLPADRVEAVVRGVRSDPQYVSHHVEAEEDGQFTVVVIFRA